MHEITIYECDIDAEEQNKLLDFLKRKCNKFSIENEDIICNFKFRKTKKNIKCYPGIIQGYLGNKITRESNNSVGGPYNILFFDITVLEAIIGKKGNVFDYIYIGNKQFWDLTFYNKDEVVFSVHTDDKCAYCEFDDNLFREFKELKGDLPWKK